MSVKGPNQVMQLPDLQIGFDTDAFDDSIRAHGVPLVHYRAMRCPIGLSDVDDHRRAHPHHSSDCSFGFLHTKAGEFVGLFLNNVTNDQQMDMGIAQGATVNIVCPRFYEGPEGATPEEILPAAFDRIELADPAIHVTHWQLMSCQPNQKDRLSFPAVKIMDVVDSRGVRYYPGTDLVIENGGIKWIKNWPGLDPKTGKGVVYSIRYQYRPFWLISRVVHEVRVATAENEFTGERKTVRMPQMLQLQREYVYLNQERDDMLPDQSRQVPAAPDGLFGPR